MRGQQAVYRSLDIGGSDRKSGPDFTVEHSSVEVDTLVPGREAVGPLSVDISLVGGVVGLSNVLLVVTGEEGVGISGELIKPRV